MPTQHVRPSVRQWATLIAITIISVAGCSSPEPQAAPPPTSEPVPTLPGEPAPPPPLSTSTIERPRGPLVNTDPCTLFTAAEGTQLGFVEPGRRKNVGHARACNEFRMPPPRYGQGSVAIFDIVGIGDIDPADKPTPITIGRHQAVERRLPAKAICDIVIATSETSRVDVGTVTLSTELERGCEIAYKMARIVEAKLP
ncbi:DUF3558 family protein [Herbihabitans rhizosphaerae]|nr:DUF3558 family protein [Herbihabitans rhizosphaerae]